VPAGQPMDAAPSRSVAGKSAALENPAHPPALPIVTRRAKTTGLVRASEESGSPSGSVPEREQSGLREQESSYTDHQLRIH
jgi:hypothetical protein